MMLFQMSSTQRRVFHKAFVEKKDEKRSLHDIMNFTHIWVRHAAVLQQKMINWHPGCVLENCTLEKLHIWEELVCAIYRP